MARLSCEFGNTVCSSQIQCFAGKKSCGKVGGLEKRVEKLEKSCGKVGEGKKFAFPRWEVERSRGRYCCVGRCCGGKELPPRVGRPVSRSA